MGRAASGVLNRAQDLSGIRVGLHDEIFQGARPVLAGVDAGSTYCYLLAAEAHRDGDTWGVHLLEAAQQGLAPDYTIADAGRGLRAGQKAAWGDTPCHGDVFHIEHQGETLANTPGNLARDIRTLTEWLRHDILSLAGPCLATRQALFDFIVEQLREREAPDVRRIRPVRIALQNQRDDLLAFAGVLDGKLAAIAQRARVPEKLVRAACVLHRKPRTLPAYWQGWGRLRAGLGGQFHAVFAAVSEAMAHTPRSSSLVENLNSRLRNYFTLRPSGQRVPRPAALLFQSSPLRAQPPGRAPRQESM
ncbi:hypothetical protein [Paraburkholderia madseniana]|uniref:hypothetical protein n=1 Tax=Paraburkholderia madseniana TaxID=2599607 RepID=UPI0018ECC92B|nr:hypothetical protein [Paraburkholderia madseniana]